MQYVTVLSLIALFRVGCLHQCKVEWENVTSSQSFVTVAVLSLRENTTLLSYVTLRAQSPVRPAQGCKFTDSCLARAAANHSEQVFWSVGDRNEGTLQHSHTIGGSWTSEWGVVGSPALLI